MRLSNGSSNPSLRVSYLGGTDKSVNHPGGNEINPPKNVLTKEFPQGVGVVYPLINRNTHIL